MENYIFNTPCIKINYKYKNKIRSFYTKLEFFNITGSIKDRVAYYIIKNAKEKNILKNNMSIVEATSGNTGISLSAIGAYYKHTVNIFMPDWVSKERLSIMKFFGAKVTLFSKKDGGFLKCIKEAKKFSKLNNAFLTNQFENSDNILAHYETTGKEILENLNYSIGAFVSGIGTGGTIIGVGKKLKEYDNNIVITAIEPEKVAILSNRPIIGNHKIEGIGDDFIPKIVDKEIIDEIILINDDDAINMSRKLAKELGLGVGISSGANTIGSILTEYKIKNNVVTIFADDNKKYLSTELAKDINSNPEFISNQVTFLNYEFI